MLLGTVTTMVGDPTGKTDMRKMLTVEQIDHNAMCFQRQMSKFLDFGEPGEPGKAFIARNGDWLKKLNYIEFLRDVGVHFSVNKMLTAECFRSRMEKGLSFLEFNYMLMQSYDFLHLYRTYNCKMELGGDDQWSNIIGGVELVRRAEGQEVSGMTWLLYTSPRSSCAKSCTRPGFRSPRPPSRGISGSCGWSRCRCPTVATAIPGPRRRTRTSPSGSTPSSRRRSPRSTAPRT